MLIKGLLPGTEAARRAGFADTQAFYDFCRREGGRGGAPRLIRISPRKHYVNREEFEAWLAERLGAAAEKPEVQQRGSLLSRVLKFPTR